MPNLQALVIGKWDDACDMTWKSQITLGLCDMRRCHYSAGLLSYKTQLSELGPVYLFKQNSRILLLLAVKHFLNSTVSWASQWEGHESIPRLIWGNTKRAAHHSVAFKIDSAQPKRVKILLKIKGEFRAGLRVIYYIRLYLLVFRECKKKTQIFNLILKRHILFKTRIWDSRDYFTGFLICGIIEFRAGRLLMDHLIQTPLFSSGETEAHGSSLSCPSQWFEHNLVIPGPPTPSPEIFLTAPFTVLLVVCNLLPLPIRRQFPRLKIKPQHCITPVLWDTLKREPQKYLPASLGRTVAEARALHYPLGTVQCLWLPWLTWLCCLDFWVDRVVGTCFSIQGLPARAGGRRCNKKQILLNLGIALLES